MILVFDSNVWISALQFSGTPLAALDLATGQHRIALCEHILWEVHSALEDRFSWRPEEVDEALAEYAPEAFDVQVTGTVREVCRDRDDDPVIECAIVAGASLIVSGDKDLLAVGKFESIRILTPREFLDEFAAQPKP